MNRRAYTRDNHYGYREPRMKYLNDPIVHRSQFVEYIPDDYPSRHREPKIVHSSRPSYYREPAPVPVDRYRSSPFYAMDDMPMEVYREPVVEREYRQPRYYHRSSSYRKDPYVMESRPEVYHEEVIQPSRYDRGYSSSRNRHGGSGEVMWTSRDKYDRYDDRGYSSRGRYDDYNGGYMLRRSRSDPSIFGGY